MVFVSVKPFFSTILQQGTADLGHNTLTPLSFCLLHRLSLSFPLVSHTLFLIHPLHTHTLSLAPSHYNSVIYPQAAALIHSSSSTTDTHAGLSDADSADI